MRTVTIFFMLTVAARLCIAQWVQTNGPFCGGQINGFAMSGPTLFAGGGNSIFVSTDNGNTWTKVNTELQGVRSLVQNGTSLFAGAINGVYRSTDNGSTWTPTGFSSRRVSALTMHGTTLLAGTDDAVFGQSIYRSTDGGANWINASVGLPQWISATGFAGNDEDIFISTWGQGVFRSTNDGITWSAVNSSVGESVFSLLVNGSCLFAGTYGGVQLSTDNGTSWTQTALTAYRIGALAVSGTSIFAGAYYGDGVFVSTDNGTSWTAVNSGLAETNITALAANGSNLFAGTYNWGIFLSTNRGTNWTYVTSGEPNANVWCLLADGSRVFAGTSPASVFLSTDNGTSWTLPNSGLVPTGSVSSIAFSGSRIFAGLGWYVFPRSFGGSVFGSTDNGANWVECNSGMNESYVSCLLFERGNLFAGRTDGVFRSTDEGANWTAIDSGLGYPSVRSLAFSNGNLFAGTWGGGVFLSTNMGEYWYQTGLLGCNVLHLAIVGGNVLAGTGGGVAMDSLFRSADNGTTWTLVHTGFAEASLTALAVSGGNVFASTAGNGVFLSTDVGASWSAVNVGLINTDVQCLAIQGTHLFAGTYGGGVWRRPLSEMTTDVESEMELPRHFALMQNYPNPFNPITKIGFSVPDFGTRSRSPEANGQIADYGLATLKVYDVLGREVATLVNEVKQPGMYTVQWDGSRQASGVYFYRLDAGSFTNVKKLILLK